MGPPTETHKRFGWFTQMNPIYHGIFTHRRIGVQLSLPPPVERAQQRRGDAQRQTFGALLHEDPALDSKEN